MPPRTPNFAAHASLDVWQFIRLAPRSSLLRQTQPGATTHDRTPTAPRGVGEGEPGGSGDGLGGDVDGALARRAVLFEEVVVGRLVYRRHQLPKESSLSHSSGELPVPGAAARLAGCARAKGPGRKARAGREHRAWVS